MIAYFALLSFVPLRLPRARAARPRGPRRRVELPRHGARARRSRRARVDEHRQRRAHDPGQRRDARRRSAAVFLLWTSLSLFSVLESAFNIVYGGRTARSCTGSCSRSRCSSGRSSRCSSALLVGSIGYERRSTRFAPAASSATRTSRTRSRSLVSSVAVFVFLFFVYYLLTNDAADVARACCRARSSPRSRWRRASRCCRSTCAFVRRT